ncbi:MAG: hypothetical protein ACE5DM_01045, partial [Candidatus Nanoarchaeia archaeon]
DAKSQAQKSYEQQKKTVDDNLAFKAKQDEPKRTGKTEIFVTTNDKGVTTGTAYYEGAAEENLKGNAQKWELQRGNIPAPATVPIGTGAQKKTWYRDDETRGATNAQTGERVYLYCDGKSSSNCVWTDEEGEKQASGTIIKSADDKVFYTVGSGGKADYPPGEDGAKLKTSKNYKEALVAAGGKAQGKDCPSCTLEKGILAVQNTGAGSKDAGQAAQDKLKAQIEQAGKQSAKIGARIDTRNKQAQTATDASSHLSDGEFTEADFNNLQLIASDPTMDKDTRENAAKILEQVGSEDDGVLKYDEDKSKALKDDEEGLASVQTAFDDLHSNIESANEVDKAKQHELQMEAKIAEEMSSRISAGADEAAVKKAYDEQYLKARQTVAYNALQTDLNTAAGLDAAQRGPAQRKAWQNYYGTQYGYGDKAVTRAVNDQTDSMFTQSVLASGIDWKEDKNGNGVMDVDDFEGEDRAKAQKLYDQAQAGANKRLGQKMTKEQINVHAGNAGAASAARSLEGNGCSGCDVQYSGGDYKLTYDGKEVTWNDKGQAVDSEGNAIEGAPTQEQWASAKSEGAKSKSEEEAKIAAEENEVEGKTNREAMNKVTGNLADRHMFGTGQDAVMLPGTVIPPGKLTSTVVDGELVYADPTTGKEIKSGFKVSNWEGAEEGSAKQPPPDGAIMCSPDGTCSDYNAEEKRFEARKQYWTPGNLMDWVRGGPTTTFLRGLAGAVGARCRVCKDDALYQFFEVMNIAQKATEWICDAGYSDELGESFAISRTGGPSQAWIAGEVIQVGDICASFFTTGSDEYKKCMQDRNLTSFPYIYKLQALVNAQEVIMTFQITLSAEKGGEDLALIGTGPGQPADLTLDPEDESTDEPPILDWHGPNTKVFGMSKYLPWACIHFRNAAVNRILTLETSPLGSLAGAGKMLCNHLPIVSTTDPYDPNQRQWEGSADMANQGFNSPGTIASPGSLSTGGPAPRPGFISPE